MPTAEKVTRNDVDCTWLPLVLECAYQTQVRPKVSDLVANLGSLFQPKMVRMLIDDHFRSDPEWLRAEFHEYCMNRIRQEYAKQKSENSIFLGD